MNFIADDDKIYRNNIGRKSFQWQVWPYCNSKCKFCFLGGANDEYIKERQQVSLHDLNNAINSLDYNEYNNISLIGGEFFQGQLADPETYNLFFDTIKNIFSQYQQKHIGSIWLTCTLTIGDQKDLYTLLDLAEEMGIFPKDGYGDSGIWLCTSWDVAGRFHNDKMRENWEYHMKNIKQKYPWIRFNTTIILQQKFIEMYINNQFKPREFMEKYHTSIFYMQPCLTGITEMMLQHEKGELCTGKDFDVFWLNLKQEFNKTFEFFPKRSTFLQFLTKYKQDDNDSFMKLFNIYYRSDEIHLNINSEEHDRTVSRVKDGSAPEESFPPPMKCHHVYNYAPYVDSNKCCICDRDAIAE